MKHSAQLKQQAIKLRLKGKSLKEISSQLPISKSTASLWLRHVKLPLKAEQILQQKTNNRYFKPGNALWQKAKRNQQAVKWTSEKIKQIKHLYHSGLSMRQVGEKMHASVWAISSVMKRHHIPRRTPGQTHKIQFYKSPLSFKPKPRLTPKQQQLKTAGLMLYWAEGGKKQPTKVHFTNSDPLMIKIFLKCLREIYQVNESRLRALVYCYPSHNIQQLTNYWQKITQIPTPQFIKPYIRKDGGNKRDKMKYGLIHISYSDKRLLSLILKEIRLLSYNI